MFLRMSRFLFLIYICIVTLTGCFRNDPEAIKKNLESLDCISISHIEISKYVDGREEMLVVKSEERKCFIISLLKEKIKKPHFDYLPTNQNLEHFYASIYGKNNSKLYSIQSGIQDEKRGFIMVMNTKEFGFLDLRQISDVEFPKEILSIFDELYDLEN